MRVLSIDFDIIMAPCINLYNDMAGEGQNSQINWEKILYERKLENFLCYDSKILTDLFSLLKQQDCKFEFIESHADIVPFITEKCDLTNIDFHHDIYYQKESTEKFADNKWTCANWVSYLEYKGLLSSYYWIKSGKSQGFFGEFKTPFEKDNSDKIPYLGSFDKVIICFSPNWVPYKFRHLYDLIKVVFSEKC